MAEGASRSRGDGRYAGALQVLARHAEPALAELARTTDGSQVPDAYGLMVSAVADVAAECGLLGLMDICQYWHNDLDALTARGATLGDDLRGALRTWPTLVELYLSRPDMPATADALVAHLRMPIWQTPIDDVDASQLARCLKESPVAAAEETCTIPPDTVEVPDDSSMALETLWGVEAVAPLAPLDDMDPDDALASLDDFAPAEAMEALEIRAAPLAQLQPSEPIERIEPIEQTAPSAALPKQIRELMEMLLAEMPELETVLDALAGLAASEDVSAEVVDESYLQAIGLMERLGAAGESLGLAGLQRVTLVAADNLRRMQTSGERIDAPTQSLWRQFPALMSAYLRAPLDPGARVALCGFVADERLAQPLPLHDCEDLEARLATPDFAVLEQFAQTRETVAEEAAVSLAIPEDVNPELLDGLLQELPQQAEDFSEAIQRMIAGGSLADVNVAQRVAHTLKGAGNTVGVRGLAELTHHLEDILLALAKHDALPSRGLGQSLMNASDCLEAMAEHLQGAGPAPADRLQVLQDVMDWANRIDRHGPPTDDEQSAASANAGTTASGDAQQAPDDFLPADLMADALDAPLAGEVHAAAPGTAEAAPGGAELKAQNGAEAPGEAAGAMLRVPTRLVDELLRLVGEAIILSGQLRDGVNRTHQNARLMENQFEHLRGLGAELERLVDIKDLSQARGATNTRSAFDSLEFDQYSELHSYSRRLIEAAMDARELGRGVAEGLTQLSDLLVTQESLNRDTQESVLNTRLVPVKSVFARLHRTVRQAARLTDKKIDARLIGGDTLMDSDVLAQVVDPLMHLLRNAIDHGIEPLELRRERRKSETGTVRLEFARDGSNIVVRCQDDGGGLDYAAIRATAVARGLLGAADEANEEFLRHLILRPNFTTRDSATQTSGRGIGLDAVASRVTALGGSLVIRSSAGGGCLFEVKLPATLLSGHALLAQVGEQTLALTTRGVEQIMHAKDGELRHFGAELVFQSGDKIYPARALDSLLGYAATPTHAEAMQRYRTVLVVSGDSGPVALLVESIRSSGELVVKTLGRYIPKLRGIVGATILGDGTVTPVVDAAEALRAPEHEDASMGTITETAAARPGPSRTAMVVDDSLSARRSLAQLLGDSGFRVLTARDGMEAVDELEKTRPDILFVDLEMPRMNGIELTAHVRANPAMASVPVVMVTSRSTPKHRAQAASAGVNVYLTKPFADDTLLEHARELLASR